MTAAQLIDGLRHDGCAVYRLASEDASAEAMDVVVDCPSGVLTPHLREALKRDRDGIRAELQRQACEISGPKRPPDHIGYAPRGWSAVGWLAYATYRADRCDGGERAAWWRSQTQTT